MIFAKQKSAAHAADDRQKWFCSSRIGAPPSTPTQAARKAIKEVDAKYVNAAADAAYTMGKRALPMK